MQSGAASACRYTGDACELCQSGWVSSQEYCVPFTPLTYAKILWQAHLAGSAPAPAPALRALPPTALAPGPALHGAPSHQANAPANRPASGAVVQNNDTGSIESGSASVGESEPAGPAAAPGLSPAALGTSPASALGLNDGALGGADSAHPDPNGSHVMLLSGTSAGGLCILVLLLLAAVYCFKRHKRSKQLQHQKAYELSAKPSNGGMEEGLADSCRGHLGSYDYDTVTKGSPHRTTPKGLRQVYAKAMSVSQGKFLRHCCCWSGTCDLIMQPKPCISR